MISMSRFPWGEQFRRRAPDRLEKGLRNLPPGRRLRLALTLEAVEEHAAGDDELLREHAAWALQRMLARP